MKALIGKKAPEFHAPAVVNGNEIIEDFSLEQYVGKKYVVMFFYPMDFTFVCPTELHAFQQKLQEFERRKRSGGWLLRRFSIFSFRMVKPR